MSHYNVKPIRLDFKPSYRLVGLLLAAGFGSSVVIICMPLGGLLRIVLCLAALLATGYHILDKGLLRLPWSCSALTVDAKGKLSIRARDGADHEITLLANSFVASYLTVLNYRIEGEHWQRSILLLSDNTDAEAFRQIRVWLRWSRQTSLATET